MSQVVRSARKSLTWLVIVLVGMFGLLAAGITWSTATPTPGLALDLAGGRQIIMQVVVEGDEAFTQDDLAQAVEVIRRRIDASGVAEAEISTQGSDTIAVGLPGNPSDATIDLIRQSAQLQFRPVLVVGTPFPTDPDLLTDEPPTAPDLDVEEPVASPSPDAQPSPGADPSPAASEEPVVEDAAVDDAAVDDAAVDDAAVDDAAVDDAAVDDAAAEEPGAQLPPPGTEPYSYGWLTDDLLDEFASLDCLDPANRTGRTMGDPETGYVACALDGSSKYALGPVVVWGSQLDGATSGPALGSSGVPTGFFAVNLDFTSEGAGAFDAIASNLYDFPETDDRNRFAIVLDGAVLSAPNVQARSYGGTAQITGSFDQASAETLANQLKFGAIPVTLEERSNDQISATRGQEQLQRALLAGGIGMLLVFLYGLIQYRALGIVMAVSLVLAGVTTFGLISLLSWGMDYRLSLAGVAGLIVAIGITADSFVVYFERIRDELREGRSLQSALDFAWRRARRTIVASDVISLVAAVTLYLVAVGGVRGFAFTLGLITVVDVFIVYLFTHPVMTLLARTGFFAEGHKLSGLDPRHLGRESLYKGRGRVKSTPPPSDGLTLAERKAAARAAMGDQS